MNISKTFDAINHDLWPTKLPAYGFFIYAISLMCSLKNCKRSIQINNNFSSAKTVTAGFIQGSIDRLLLFTIFINNLVLFLIENIPSNYADDKNLSV